MSKKAEPRQIPMGKCGHKITRVKTEGVMAWYCYEACGHAAEFSHLHLVPRGKAK
jgi:hypothetical protein